MIPPSAAQHPQRHEALLLLTIWLLACALMIRLTAAAISIGSFPDPDDMMRLLEVRDWMAGQSWFDVSQYRLNGSAGVPMHWSRLVDVPIALVIFATRPLLGPDKAETAALVLVPLLTLGIAMLLVHRIASRLLTSRAALVAVAATPLSLGAMKQMRPMRIDHHGWQIVLALAGILASLDRNPRRSGVIAGTAMALWLNISIEGLPFAAALGVLFAFEWLRDARAATRLKAYLGALAIVSVALFGLTHAPSSWMAQQHDVVTIAHLAGFAAASLFAAVAVRPSIQTVPMRIVMLALTGAVSLCAMFAVDAHWFAGPFGALDPMVRKFWYDKVDEGLPMWQVDSTSAAIGLAQPLIGLFGAGLAFWRAGGPERGNWGRYIWLLSAATLGSIFVLRIATTASVIAMPGTAYLCQFAFRRARAQGIAPVRVVTTAAALFVMAPAYALPASMTSTNARVEKAVHSDGDCETRSEMEKLQALGTREIAAPLDITPAILLRTSNRAIASGHHRNVTGMRDVIRLFVEPASSGAKIIKERNIDYVVICPGAPETIRYAANGPRGLTAMLTANKAPNWLEPTRVPGLTALRIWRVRRDLLP